MIEKLGGVTTQLIRVALDAALLRHQVIANNIANANTPGYQVKRLNFEEHLSGFTSELTSYDEHTKMARLDSVAANLHEGSPMVVSDNETVELDREMIKLTENTIRYQAILKTAGLRGELLSMAINGGRK